jgi:hypothetical protein
MRLLHGSRFRPARTSNRAHSRRADDATSGRSSPCGSRFSTSCRTRRTRLEYIAKPRPFKDQALREVKIRILGDVALIHGRVTYTMLADGAEQDALYTDVYQKREGTWVCVSACAIAPGA